MNLALTLNPNWPLLFENNFHQNKIFKISKLLNHFVNNFRFMHLLTGGNELQSHFHAKNLRKNYANGNQFVTGSQFQNFPSSCSQDVSHDIFFYILLRRLKTTHGNVSVKFYFGLFGKLSIFINIIISFGRNSIRRKYMS